VSQEAATIQPEVDNAERRRHDRVRAVVEVSVTSEHNFYTGFTSDISEGGVFIAGIGLRPIGTMIDFQLRLGKGEVAVRGVVRWVRELNEYTQDVPPGMGVEFIDLHPEVQAKINTFLRKKRESIFWED